MPLKKLTNNFDEDLIKQVDNYANSLHINRTAAMSVLLSQGLLQSSGIDTMKQLIEIYEKENVNK